MTADHRAGSLAYVNGRERIAPLYLATDAKARWLSGYDRAAELDREAGPG